MKLLLIEDNRSLADSLKKHLGKSFIVDVTRSGEEGQRHALTENHDVIVLDLNLPDKNGSDVCKAIRAAQVSTPILILTAVSDIPTRVSLLNSGADDYLTKPFSIAELRARLNVLLRRTQSTYSNGLLTVSDLVVDPNRRHVERAGISITLRRKEFDILEYLLRNRGRAVTRAMILDHAWNTNRETWHNTVDVHIKHLRDKVDRPFNPPLIKTAYGIGYMIDDA